MRLKYWITVFALGIALVIVLPISLIRYGERDSIRRVSDVDFLQTISSTLRPTNAHFDTSVLSIKDVRYVNDSVAVVKIFNSTDSVGSFLVFELQHNTLSVTNYSSSFFVAGDFAVDSSVAEQIINTASGM